MTIVPMTPNLGFPPIDVTKTAEHPYAPWKLGDIIRATDTDTGLAAEYIYLKGVANTAVNDQVSYDTETFATSKAVAEGDAIATAMSANIANQYGWYRIERTAAVQPAA